MSSNSNITDGKTKKKKKTKTKKRNWKEYNESLVRRGEITFNTDFLSNWPTELKEYEQGKKRSEISLQIPFFSCGHNTHLEGYNKANIEESRRYMDKVVIRLIIILYYL